MDANSSTEDLIALVKSMDGSERRYFRMHCAGKHNGEEKRFLQLYDHLLVAGEWSEAALEVKFQSSSFMRQPNVARYKLQQMILESLRRYNHGKTWQLDFSSRIDAIEILLQRKLYPACSRAIKASLRKAKSMGLPQQELIILRLSIRLERLLGGADLPKRIQQIHDRVRVLLMNIQVETDLTEMLDAIMDLVPKTGNANAEVLSTSNRMSSSPLLHTQPEGFDSRILWHYNLAYLAYIRGDWEVFFQQHSAISDVWDECPERIRQEEERYFKMLTGYAQSCRLAGHKEEMPKVLGKLKRLLDRSRQLQKTETPRVMLLELNHWMDTCAWEAAGGMVPGILAFLEDNPKSIPAVVRQGLLSNLIVLHTLESSWEDLILLTTAMGKDGGLAALVSEWVHVCRWIAWYSLGDLDQLEKAIRAKQRSAAPSIQQDLLASFAALTSAIDAGQEARALQEIADISQTDGRERYFMNILIWSRSRIEGVAMHKLAEQLKNG